MTHPCAELLVVPGTRHLRIPADGGERHPAAVLGFLDRALTGTSRCASA
ncbi:MAG TPA: hypothetical protein VGP02_04155 [Mycobacteriales bacterium]|nr:hypothetical protein [Mycobacteriales bacterium]